MKREDKSGQAGVSMNSNEWQQIGEDIKEQVQSAIDSNDFSGLSRTISETVSMAIGDVGKSVSGAVNDAMNEMRDTFQQTVQKKPHHSGRPGVYQNYDQSNSQNSNPYAGQNYDQSDNPYAGQNYVRNMGEIKKKPWKGAVYYGKPNLRPDKRYFVRRPKGSVAGILQIILGFGIGGLAGCFFVVAMIAFLLEGGIDVLLGILFLLGIPTVAGLLVGVRGIGLTERVERFKRYVTMLQEKMYCSIEDLAEATGKSKKFILKDLRRMTHQGWFLQGHIDKQESCFIASDQVYEQYRLTQNNYEEERKKQAESNAAPIDENEVRNRTECDKILEEGREYIRTIRLCNDEIPGEEMSEKLDKLEFLVTRIFAQVEKEPELAPELHKMLNYYLPTTQKLLVAYRDLDKQNVEVSNISKTKKEIEAAVDTINQAFEKFLDELFREKAWDIQTDISVLNTMLKQDGYLNGDFEKNKNEKG